MRCFLDATNQRKQEANRVEMPRKLLLALRHVPRLRSVPQAHGTRSLRGATLRYDSIRVQYILLMRESVCVRETLDDCRCECASTDLQPYQHFYAGIDIE